MIYIIIDESYEWDDYTYSRDKIVYVGTNKEDAIVHFKEYYGDTINRDSTKYCYEYSLFEYPDGWNIYEVSNSKNTHLICHITNVNEGE